MIFNKSFLYLFVVFGFLISCSKEEAIIQCEVLVLGEGTGATSAAIQSARSGAKTILINPQPWLGGMLTSAGVSATDGNHKLPAGLWGEFRQYLRDHYGGTDSLFTGWVSNTMFEPKVGAKIWKQMAEKETLLTVHYEATWKDIEKDGAWSVQVQKQDGSTITVQAKILIDGTDLGDVAAAVGASYDLGMDAQTQTNEAMAPAQANDIVQDLTYVAILEDYGPEADKTIPEPPNYDPTPFYCSCKPEQPNDLIPSDLDCEGQTVHPCPTMLTYGLLPNKKYMINWPLSGNDYYLNLSEMSLEEREIALQKAKDYTLSFVYYIQTVLGFKNLGLAEDAFPTEDGLALMPYHREGRRIKGMVQMNVNHILEPYASNLYKTGIAVGDYPIDHHHFEYEGAPEIDFPPVPSFNVPMGALIPKDIEDLLVADKAISVTNIVNGSSRLQPVIIQIGQATGLMGAMAAKENISPAQLSVRAVQESLVKAKGYLMPFIDVPSDHPYFEACQKVGASGILKGRGVPYLWANQTWFDVDTSVRVIELVEGWETFTGKTLTSLVEEDMEKELTIEGLVQLFSTYLSSELKEWNPKIEPYNKEDYQKLWEDQLGLSNFDPERKITKGELAVWLNSTYGSAFNRAIDLEGNWVE